MIVPVGNFSCWHAAGNINKATDQTIVDLVGVDVFNGFEAEQHRV